MNLLWKVQGRPNIVGDIRHCDSAEHSSFLGLRTFFGRSFCRRSFRGRARRHFSELDFERFLLTFPIDFNLYLRAGLHRADHQTQLPRIVYFLSVNGGNHVASFESRFFRRSFRRDLANQGAGRLPFEFHRFSQLGRERLHRRADVTPHDASFVAQTLHHIAREIRGNRKTDTLVPAVSAENGSVNA